MKKISKKMQEKIEKEVKNLLHCHRDTLRNRVNWKRDNETGELPPRHNPLKTRFDCTEGLYGEAFGIMRALQVLGYGEFESSNLPGTRHHFEQDEQNLKWWFCQLEDEVLEEENFHGNHRCEHCLNKYGRDDLSMIEKGYLEKRDRP